MRAHHALVVAAVLLVGFGAKLFFFSAPKANAGVHVVNMDIHQMHLDYRDMTSLPVEKVHDTTFVFAEGD